MKLKRRIRNFLLNSLLVSASLYFSGVLASYLIPKVASRLLYPPEVTQRQLDKKVLEAERQKAIQEGYLEIFRPHSFNYSYRLRDISEASSSIVVGALPNGKVHVCDEGYGLVKEKLDRMGFRNDDRLWDKISSIEAIIVGDSMAFGECVPKNNTISDKLFASGIKTLNLGMGSNSTGEYALTQQIYIPKIKPDFVISIFYPNDRSSIAENLFFEFTTNRKFLENYITSKGDALHLSAETKDVYKKISSLIEKKETGSIDNWDEWFIDKLLGSRHWRLDGFRPFLVELLKPNLETIDSGTRESLLTTERTCNRYGCTPIFVYIPNDMFFDRDPLAESYLANLERFVLDRDGHFIDTTSVLYQNKEQAYSPHGGHLSPEGYRIVSEELISVITQIKQEQSKRAHNLNQRSS